MGTQGAPLLGLKPISIYIKSEYGNSGSSAVRLKAYLYNYILRVNMGTQGAPLLGLKPISIYIY